MEFTPRNKRKNYFIYVGRLDKTKGIEKLIESWKILTIAFKNTPQLIICGSGPEEQYCSKYILEHNLQKIVKMLGYVENKIAVQYIAESKALILPTQWYEGFPMTIVEAYGCGTPVLGSKIGNVGNLVIEGVTGFTFDQNSAESIVNAVQKIIDTNESGKDLYKSTFDYYITKYTEEDNYRLLMSIYENVMK